jgi:predicted RNA polymerase sigma factor
LVDQLRSDSSRRDREQNNAVLDLTGPTAASAGPGDDLPGDQDDTLTLLFLCCHPALSPPSQLALTLRAVGGLTTAEIAGAFLVPEATMGQRISRAKQAIRKAGLEFRLPPDGERSDRLAVVLQVLYLIFNEGYIATSGAELLRADLTSEATRLARLLCVARPDDGEAAGLLALMVLTEARRRARTGPDGGLIPLDEQDRSLWDGGLIAEGVELITDALSTKRIGPYQVQAAIAAVHDEAARAEDTDWAEILELYQLLEFLSPSPVVTLNRAVAVAMVDGPSAGLAVLQTLDDDDRLADHHRLASVRAHLLEMNGDLADARDAYRRAARRTTSLPEQRYLDARAARLAVDR